MLRPILYALRLALSSASLVPPREVTLNAVGKNTKTEIMETMPNASVVGQSSPKQVAKKNPSTNRMM